MTSAVSETDVKGPCFRNVTVSLGVESKATGLEMSTLRGCWSKCTRTGNRTHNGRLTDPGSWPRPLNTPAYRLACSVAGVNGWVMRGGVGKKGWLHNTVCSRLSAWA